MLQNFKYNILQTYVYDLQLIKVLQPFLLGLPFHDRYSHLFNKSGGWNKRGGGAKVTKSLNVEAGINVEGGIFWKKLVHKSNKRGVEGGKI